MTTMLELSPIDILHLRGNQLFGEAGSHGELLMPPWPSVFAGALRTRMLVDHGIDLRAFPRMTRADLGPLGDVLGTPRDPGTFRVTAVVLGRKGSDGGCELLVPLPADCVVERTGPGPAGVVVRRLVPAPVAALGPGILASFALPWAPVLQSPAPCKPSSGYWLTGTGLGHYLAGGQPQPEHLVHQDELWRNDPRLGIALDPRARTAAEGMLYTCDTVALRDGVSFLVGVDGSGDGLLPAAGLVRLGGDGRGARVAPWPCSPPWEAVPDLGAGGFTLTMATPGIFRGGWCPPGLHSDGELWVLRLGGLEARLLAAAIPRHQVVSGWDLAERRPKAARRVVPAGSVFWFEILKGDPQVLDVLVRDGLWHLVRANGKTLDGELEQRRAEGFNNVWLGSWNPQRPAA